MSLYGPAKNFPLNSLIYSRREIKLRDRLTVPNSSTFRLKISPPEASRKVFCGIKITSVSTQVEFFNLGLVVD